MDPDPGNYHSFFLLMDQLPWWPEISLQFLLLAFLILMSFVVSSSEVAYFSLTKAELDAYKDSSVKREQGIWRLISSPDKLEASRRLLATILITNNFMNVAAILVASNLLRTFAAYFAWTESVIFLLELVLITSMLLLFGEIIPKVYAAKYRRQFAVLLYGTMIRLRWFLNPLAQGLITITRFIDRRVQFKEEKASLEDLKYAIELTTNDVNDKEEKEILKGIVNFGNIPVKSAMRARVDVVALDIQTPWEELLSFINENSYSRFPVYEESLDKVIGILHIKDLLPYVRDNSRPKNLRELVRDVSYVPESKKIDSLLEEFKTQRLHMAVVVDEFGGTSGIITLDDIIEEIFGEISDEFDSEDWIYTKLSEDTYIFEGRISLNDVRRILNLEDEVFEDARGDSDSLGGLILELHGKIPSVGETLQYRNFELLVEGVSKHRITQVKFKLLPEEEINPS